MSVFILTWNPSKWTIPDDDYAGFASEVSAAGAWQSNWSTGSRKSGVFPGDTALLLRQHRDRGIVAGGSVTSEVYEGPHYNRPEETAHYVDVSWSAWLPLDDRLPIEILKSKLPMVIWDRIQGSGVRVPSPSDRSLHELWTSHVERLGRAAEELPPGRYPEGATTRIEVNRYERSAQAREVCIRHHGKVCSVCGFDFAAAYGAMGDGYIHVHHLTDLALAPPGYTLDPIADLRPVCANCHAMLHRERPAMRLAKLRTAVRNQRRSQ